MNRCVLRYEVPVDDLWHRVEHAGDAVYVASRDPVIVEFWTVDHVGVRLVATGDASIDATYAVNWPPARYVWEYRVFCTGQPVAGCYVGTAVTAGGQIVWHLFRREVAR